MKHTASVILLAVAVMLFPLSGRVPAQETAGVNPIITSGIAHINGGSIVKARDRAIADAQKKALMEAVGSLMTFDSLEKQFVLFASGLFNRADFFIESYRVLHDSTLGDRYHISLQSTIAFDTLKEYLFTTQSIAPQAALPRILLMIAQQRFEQDFYTCWWSFIDPERELTAIDQAVRNELQQAGFEVIDHTLLTPRRTTNVYGCLDIGTRVIQALGAQFQANIAIVGNARVALTAENQDPPQKVMQASITARAIKIQDGSLVASGEVHFPAAEESTSAAQEMSLRKASRAFARQMGDKISRQWSKETKGIAATTLSISGLSDYVDFSRLKSDLKKGIPEIHTVSQKTLSSTGALIEVESSLDTASLAALIEKKQFEDFTISISGVQPSLIEMEVTLKNKPSEEESP